MPDNSVVLIASIIAATGSLTTAVMTIRSSSRTEVGKWRRQEEGKVIARFLDVYDQALTHLYTSLSNKHSFLRGGVNREEYSAEMGSHWRQAYELYGEAGRIRAELELIAGRKVVETAQHMITHIEGIHHSVRPAGPADMTKVGTEEFFASSLRAKMVEVARQELNIEGFQRTRRFLQAIHRTTSSPFMRLYYRYRARAHYRSTLHDGEK